MKPIDIESLRGIEREKGIEFDTIVDALEGALASAYKRQNHDVEDARVVIDRDTGDVTVLAQEVDEDGTVLNEWVDNPRDFGRIVAQTAKQVLMQRLREAEREMTYGEYSGREGDLVTGTLQVHDNRVTVLDLGNAEAVLPVGEQVPNERYQHGTRLRAYITEVRRSYKGPQIIASRTHPNLVHELFRMEVPEIDDGTVQIKGIAREPGHRTKIAVDSTDPAVDPVGACVGSRGMRVSAIVDELNQEKIDIITWSDEPAQLVANALSPAKVDEVYLYDDEGLALVVVPDYQLSLAIGRDGQNARLAARLTGWRVDIRSQTQFAEEQAALQAAFERGEVDEHGNPIGDVEVPVEIDPAATATPQDSGPDERAPTAPVGPAAPTLPDEAVAEAEDPAEERPADPVQE